MISKNKKKKLYANNGMSLKNEDIMNLLGSLPGTLGLVGSGLNLVTDLMTDPSNYTPIKNNNITGFNKGGDIKLSQNAVEINGNEGIDTNKRVVANEQVNLTQGETIQKTFDGAFVFSNSKDMLNPINGKTFAETAKPIQKRNGRMEKTKYYDSINKNTIKANEETLAALGSLQQAMNGDQSNMDENNFATGAYITDPIKQLNFSVSGGRDFKNPNIPRRVLAGSNIVNPISNNYGSQGNPYQSALDNPTLPQIAVNNPSKPKFSFRNLIQRFNNSNAQGNNQYTEPNEVPNTIGDTVNLLSKGVALAGKGAIALQKTDQMREDKYDIDRQIYNPSNALNQNQRNFRSSNYNINSGNANTDRVYKSSLYSAKLNADADVISKYDTMQRQSDTGIDQFNSQSRRAVEDLNARETGVANTAIDSFLNSVQGVGAEYQDYANSKVENNLTVATLKSLSKRYQISIPDLRALMANDPAKFEQLIKFQG